MCVYVIEIDTLNQQAAQQGTEAAAQVPQELTVSYQFLTEFIHACAEFSQEVVAHGARTEKAQC